METITVKSDKNLNIGDYINGRKIVGKMVSKAPRPMLGITGVFHYQLPKPKRFPRRPNGAPKAVKVVLGRNSVRDLRGKFVPKESASTRPMVNFNIFSGK